MWAKELAPRGYGRAYAQGASKEVVGLKAPWTPAGGGAHEDRHSAGGLVETHRRTCPLCRSFYRFLSVPLNSFLFVLRLSMCACSLPACRPTYYSMCHNKQQAGVHLAKIGSVCVCVHVRNYHLLSVSELSMSAPIRQFQRITFSSVDFKI